MDTASTVTSLFTTPPHGYHRSSVMNRGESALKSGSYKRNNTGKIRPNSASKLLSRYIHRYEKEQTLNLAKSITNTQRKVAFNDETERNKRDREVTREIQLARQLLPAEYSNADDNVQSIATDDLLVFNPLLGASYADGENKRDITRSMHFSELSEDQITSGKGDCLFSDSTFAKNHYNGLLPNSTSMRSLSETRIASKARKQFDSDGDIDSGEAVAHISETSPSEQHDFPEILDSSTLTKNAGRTPFHHRYRKCNLSLNTEEILSGDRPWEMPIVDCLTDRSPSPTTVSMSFKLDDKSSYVRGFMEECLEESNDELTGILNLSPPENKQQFGSVEKIKNMLFTLQNMSVTSRKGTIDRSSMNHSSEEENEGEVTDGHLSFKKALTHLHNLKEIVCSDSSEIETKVQRGEFTVL